jgi:hypothetical protein
MIGRMGRKRTEGRTEAEAELQIGDCRQGNNAAASRRLGLKSQREWGERLATPNTSREQGAATPYTARGQAAPKTTRSRPTLHGGRRVQGQHADRAAWLQGVRKRRRRVTHPLFPSEEGITVSIVNRYYCWTRWGGEGMVGGGYLT